MYGGDCMKCLSDYRKARNLSKAEMANKLGVSISLYEKVEYSDRKPSRNFLSKFKKVFPDFDMNIFFEEMLHD